MSKSLVEYSYSDWMRLRPVLHALKTRRYQRITRKYVKRDPIGDGNLTALRSVIQNKKLLVTIAFNDWEMIERQLLAIRKFIPGPLHLIADNSSDEFLSQQIKAACIRLHAPYVRLPRNPWDHRSPSRSHGLALNWVWHQIIRPGEPELFGFLDHDLVPVAPDDPFAILMSLDIAGDKRWAADRWFLWAGYCFFRTAFLRGKDVDFGQDWFLGLDTGGRNWRSIYRFLPPSAVPDRPIERVAIVKSVAATDCYIERRGLWLHHVGTDNRPDLKQLKRVLFFDLIDDALTTHQHDASG